MPVSRRAFVAGLAATPLLTSVSVAAQDATTELSPDRFDPWLEIDAAALRKNVAVVSGLANNRPILAVIKNNAYGLGLTDYDGDMLVAVDLMTLAIGDKISVGRAEGTGTDIFTEADVVKD